MAPHFYEMPKPWFQSYYLSEGQEDDLANWIPQVHMHFPGRKGQSRLHLSVFVLGQLYLTGRSESTRRLGWTVG